MGRQNVGKSTLFNQIIRKKHAIVNDTPGLTRDFMEHPALINEVYYNLIDTGGLIDEKDRISRIILEQVEGLLKKADLVLFIVARTGLLPMDLEIASLVRKSGAKTILVINKVDRALDAEKSGEFAEFERLGFRHMVPVSAEHRNNFDTLYDLINRLVEQRVTELPEETASLIAVIGKPNVGKSSLVNRLSRGERLIVTEIPGTTRDSIDVEVLYHGQKFILIDTAGIRKRGKISTSIEYYSVNRSEKSVKRSHLTVMLLTADTLLTEADKKILDIIVGEQKPCILAVNKWDLVEKKKEQASLLRRRITGQFPRIASYPFLFISAKTGHNLSRLFPLIRTILEKYNKRVGTAEFNEFVQNTVNRLAPPQSGGTVKIFYGTQIRTAPPVFIFFTNRPEKIGENYRTFLVNRIRGSFGFEGCPIIVKFRKK